jgi:capsular polysaccharide export protein
VQTTADPRHAAPAGSLWEPPDGLRLAVLGRPLRAIHGLAAFLPPGARVLRPPFGLLAADALVGWGRNKGSGRWAQRLAPWLRLPIVTLEDGFVRSFGLGVVGTPALSAVVDDIGMHFDATGPSRIETMLEHGGWETEALLARARACLAEMRRLRISKYNVASEPSPAAAALLAGEPFVLCVDQTAGDVSIELGAAGPESFRRMLRAARDENPGARIVVKTHPNVATGLRRGCLDAAEAAALGAETIAEALDPWRLLDRTQRLYTVTSQMGLEALVAGVPVRCFGLPFYAGWGATEDDLACPRRSRRRSAEEIFAAAYLLYARYADPLTGAPTTLERTIATIAAWREAVSRDPGFHPVIGGGARTAPAALTP